MDQRKLRVNGLFRRFDSNHDRMLTREEFMKGLKASGKYVCKYLYSVTVVQECLQCVSMYVGTYTVLLLCRSVYSVLVCM